MVISGLVAFANHFAGNDGIKIKVHLKYTKVVKHQGGGVITFYGWTQDFPSFTAEFY